MSDLRLCQSCQNINFIGLGSISLDDIPTEGIQLASLGRLQSPVTLDCSLCQLFYNVKTIYSPTRTYQLRAYNHAYLLQARASHAGVQPVARPGLVLSVLQLQKNLRYDPRIRHHEIINNGLLLPLFVTHTQSSEPPQYPFNVQIVGQSIDWTLVNSWINVCKIHHSATCRQTVHHKVSLTIHVIDCYSRIVVSLPENVEYLALSYVWGSIHDSRLPHVIDTSSSPLPKLPKTIENAISVVVQLGYQYLWVDRHCISWSNQSALRAQIANMDQIFEGAMATIVALHGKDVNAGLPGVSNIPRKVHPVLDINGVRLVSTLPPLLDVLETSTWSKRGWTYQEGRLSQRLLFFSDSQVYYSCRATTQSEAIHNVDDITSTTLACTAAVNLPNLSPGLFATGERTRATGNHFVDDRSGYTSRSLTYPNDILDAYRGLLHRSPCHSFWGVSVIPEYPSLTTTRLENPDLGLAHGLIWIVNVRKPRTRRSGFPTWSWTSIDGHILSFSWSGSLAAGQKYIEAVPNYPPGLRSTTATFWLRDRDKYPQKLAETLNHHREHFILPELSPVLEVEADLVKIHLTQAVSGKQTSTMVKKLLCFCSNISKYCRGETDGTMTCHISLDLPDNHADFSPQQDSTRNICINAIILVSYIHESIHNTKGVVMMLLKWKDKSNTIAERLGLLRFGVPLSSSTIDEAPKLRRRICLE